MCFYFTGISFRLKLAAAPIRDICLQIDKPNFFNNIPHKYGKAEQIYSPLWLRWIRGDKPSQIVFRKELFFKFSTPFLV